jgi:hypothetical protein
LTLFPTKSLPKIEKHRIFTNKRDTKAMALAGFWGYTGITGLSISMKKHNTSLKNGYTTISKFKLRLRK